MASNKIKGLTVEIGGDTTKLGKALDAVDKRSRDLSSELGEINKLLKFDPGNADLLAQKQKVLADALANTSEKLDTLKEAEKQVQEQFERGEASEDQVRALQREIISTTKKLDGYERAAKETADEIDRLGDGSDDAVDGIRKTEKGADEAADALDELADSAEDAGDAGEGLGSKLAGAAKTGLTALAGAATAVVGALVGAAESTREYRTEMGKLDTAFTTAGHSSEAATKTYQSLQGILGETEQAVEASNHLAQLANNEEELATWTDIATGVYATFGASLPIENLTEAANETAKTGALTGGLADALNWAGVNEEAFQAQLDACTTEQERQALITDTLNGLYSETAEQYRETNAELIRANEANEAWTASLAEAGAAVEPILTDVKMLGAGLLSDLLPGITGVTEAFRGILNGDMGAADALGENLSGLLTSLLDKIVEYVPTVAQVAMSLITTLTTTLISMLPQVLSTGVEVIMALLNGLTSAIPQIVAAIADMIPQLTDALVTGIPQLIQGAVDLFMALVTALPQIIPPLIEALPQIIMALVNGLLSAIPQLLDGALQLLMAIVDAIPLLVTYLVPLIPDIVTAIALGLLDCVPQLLDASVELLMALVRAVPVIIAELIKALPKVLSTILSYLGQLPSKIWNILKSVVSNFVKWVANINTTAKDGFVRVVSAVINIAKELPTKIWNAIKGAVNKVTTWGSNLAAKGKAAAKKLLDSVVNGVKSLPSKMASIGGNIVSGVWNGISNKIGWIKSKLMGFKDAVLKALKKAFGIASPSKLMKAEVGTHIAAGVAEGITDSDEPTKAIREMNKNILDEAEEINGMTINRQLNTAFTASAPMSSAETGILGKLDKILTAIENGQILVIDGDTLVGATLSAYDAKLGQRRLLAARGAL